MGRYPYIKRRPRWQQRVRQAKNDLLGHGRIFTNHPSHVGEGYGRHLLFALTMSGRLVGMAALLVVHGVLPFLFSCATYRQLEVTTRLLRRRVHRIHRETVDPLFEL